MSWNPYVFAGDQPVTGTDPTGRLTTTEWIALGLIVGGAGFAAFGAILMAGAGGIAAEFFLNFGIDLFTTVDIFGLTDVGLMDAVGVTSIIAGTAVSVGGAVVAAVSSLF
jgi:hypothetical protein